MAFREVVACDFHSASENGGRVQPTCGDCIDANPGAKAPDLQDAYEDALRSASSAPVPSSRRGKKSSE